MPTSRICHLLNEKSWRIGRQCAVFMHLMSISWRTRHVSGVVLPTLFAFAYLDYWLCSWHTQSFYACETYNWGDISNYYINPWANDGSQYVGREYKLGVALYSQTPENHQVRYWTYPIVNW